MTIDVSVFLLCQDEKSFKFHPYEIRVYIIDYKKKEHPHHHHHHRRSHEKKEQTTDSKGSLTNRQKAALKKLEQMSNNARDQAEGSQQAILTAVAEATKKVLAETAPSEAPKPTDTATKSSTESTSNEQVIAPDSAEIDLENEPIERKRQRQRSIVLNLGKQEINVENLIGFLSENITPTTITTPETSGSFSQSRRSFSSQAASKPSFKGRHEGESSDDDDADDQPTTSTSEIDEETSDTGAKDIDYSVLYDDTIEDFSFTSAREKAKQRLLREQQQMMLKQIEEQE